MAKRKLTEITLQEAVKPLQEVAKPETQTSASPIVPKVGKLRATKLVSAAVMAEVRAEVNDFAAGVADTCKKLGEILASKDAMALQLPDVLEVESDIATGVLGTTEGPTRNVLSLAVAEAMFTNFPQTTVGLNHFANTCIAMKFLRPYRGGEYYSELPVGEAPDLIKKRLSSDVPKAIELLRRVDQVSLSLIEENEQYKKERRAQMKQLVPTFLAIVNVGVGETACQILQRGKPPEYIRLRIVDGVITATDAVGEDFAEDLIGTAIPLDEIDRGYFEQTSLKGAEDQEVKRMASLRRHLRNTLTIARAQVAFEKKRAAHALADAKKLVEAPAPAPTEAASVVLPAPESVPAPAPITNPENVARRERRKNRRERRAQKPIAAAPAITVPAATPAPETPATAEVAPSELKPPVTDAE